MPDTRSAWPIRPTERELLDPHHRAALPEHDYEKKLDEVHAALAQLIQHARAPERYRPIDIVRTGQTSAGGALTLNIYSVGQGFYVEIRRLIVECATYETTTPRTPAAPFSGASAWFSVATSTSAALGTGGIGQGAMLDFAPPAAGGQLLPAVADYTPGEMIVQGGKHVYIDMHAGPVSQMISVRLIGWLVGEHV